MSRPRINQVLCAAGAFFFRFRNGLFPVIFLLVAIFVRPAFFAESRDLDPFITGIGLLLALSGEIVRCLTIGLVYIVRGGRGGRVYAKNLVTEGIYAHTRNPMYVGNLLLALGFCLMYGSPWMYLIVFPSFILVYVSIVFEEERFLGEQFGEQYGEYVRNTNRFLPKLSGLSETLRQHRFDWKKVITKEYGTLFGFFVGASIVLMAKYRYLIGPVGILAHPGRALLFTAPFFILYGVARFLKITRRL
ncbi:MAG: isoprenylcysteine carboxylmethyltransferase family protein [Candidatus Manganitrophus sp.]|nr:isoprenylcysteine carboxylmethyltransferase family protein [Candidatus Manganitrophus sp.]WDT69378.1 MAG: isoprenylcysteine carboxylmethyltransferase family protein [Candidatus Manganitrophus sp.]WDT79036.1 MAG: isoprenylcysteine carboxylmethyltransferase family protein [Candidatus Manganitrophus sp.]